MQHLCRLRPHQIILSCRIQCPPLAIIYFCTLPPPFAPFAVLYFPTTYIPYNVQWCPCNIIFLFCHYCLISNASNRCNIALPLNLSPCSLIFFHSLLVVLYDVVNPLQCYNAEQWYPLFEILL